MRSEPVNVTPRETEAKVATRVLAAGTAAAIMDAARVLADGRLVAFPTETVYGLGADATNARAVAMLYQAKARPSFNPLIAHVASSEAAEGVGVFNQAARRLAEKFWPGPLTLVVPVQQDCAVCDLARAGLDTVALRVPGHSAAQALLREFARPVVAPSANRAGHVSPTTAEHVLTDLNGRIDLILDGGPAPLGIESTIIDCAGERPVLLRPGAVPRTAIEAALGFPLGVSQTEQPAPSAPGQLRSHYATRARLRLDATDVRPREALLAFGPNPPAGAVLTLNLSPTADLLEAGANLFGHLRALDAHGVETIAVAPIPATGLGEAIRDRLVRAAAPRPQADITHP
jgi:L-threonylcarbamoyladenylate synthase